jgi:transposase InsO family protein
MVDSVGGVTEVMSKVYVLNKENACPIAYNILSEAQQKEFTVRQHNTWPTKKYGHFMLYVTQTNCIRVPPSLRTKILDWFHSMLMHPGIQQMEETLKMNFDWPGMTSDAFWYVQGCPECQRFKKQRKNYGDVPVGDPIVTPWEVVAVDLIGLWTVPTAHHVWRANCGGNVNATGSVPSPESEPLQLMCLTVIDLATCWVEIVWINEKDARMVAKAFDQVWLSRYPCPFQCIHDQGSEFIGFEFQELLDSYGIISLPTTVQNPTANVVLEQTHQTIRNMLRTSDLQTIDFTLRDEAFDDLIAVVCFALRASYHTSMKATPTQLAFGCDMFFPTTYVANWHQQRVKAIARMTKEVEKENRTHITHDYAVVDRVLICHDCAGEVLGKLARPTYGPYRIVQVFPNGTVRIDCGRYTECINIHRLLPFHQPVH